MEELDSLEALLGDFTPELPESVRSIRGGSVTIWLPAKAKARYDKLQKSSGCRFSKKARELLIALIDLAEKRAA